jgi:hypothetical protein
MIDDKDFQTVAFNMDRESPKVEVNQPEITPNSGSDSSMEHYFPKPTEDSIEQIRSKRLEHFSPKSSIPELREPGTKTSVGEMLDIIEAKGVKNSVASSPNIGNIGLQTPIQDRLNTSPLLHKTSISNLFEDTMNLFDNEPEDAGIDTSGESIYKDETPQVETQQMKPKSSFASLFDQIKSKRLEYGSPSNTNVPVPPVTEEIPTVENDSSEDSIQNIESDIN